MLAIAPFSNSILALAISIESVRTGTPAALMYFMGDFTKQRIRSKSWTIRSRTTETSSPLILNRDNLCDSIKSGFDILSLMARNTGLNLSTCPVMRTTPFSLLSSINSSASFSEYVSGFSIKQCFPRPMIFLPIS